MYNLDLYNYNFDKDNKNVRLFESIEERELYFDSNSLFQFENVVLNANDIIDTQIVIDYTQIGITEDDLIVILNANYLRAKNSKTTLYFWIDKSTQLSGKRISLKLRIDEFQTYIYDTILGQGQIDRATLNRFQAKATDTYVFDTMQTTNLLKSEDTPVMDKRLILREKLKFIYDESIVLENADVNNWLANNVKCWVYYYVSPQQYNLYNSQQQEMSPIIYVEPSNIQNLFRQVQRGATVVLCYPIYKTDKQIQIKYNQNTYNWDFQSIQSFLTLNNGTSYVYSIKYSTKAPFNVKSFSPYMIVNLGNNNLEIALSYDVSNKHYMTADWLDLSFVQTGADKMLCCVEQQDLTPLYANVELNMQFEFTPQEIITNYNAPEYNPKCFSNKVLELTLTENGQSYTYNLQELNTNILKFAYFEVFTPDNTKTLTVYVPANNNEYLIEDTAKNYSGLCTTNDYSILFSNDRWQEYLASNKSYFENAMIRGISELGLGLFQYPFASPHYKLGNAIVGNFSRSVDMAFKMKDLTNAPDNLKNASGNAIFLNSVTDIGIYLNIYSAIKSDIETFNDYTKEFGYVVAKHDSVNVYLRQHKVFDYIEAECEYIRGHISEDIRSMLRNKIKRGVRFWYIDAINYELPNYERYLEPEEFEEITVEV